MKTMKHEKLGSFFIAIGLVLAALATPSASAYGAVSWFGAGIASINRAVIDTDTREAAINALNADDGICNVRRNTVLSAGPSECVIGTVFFNNPNDPDNTQRCVAAASTNSSGNPAYLTFATGPTPAMASAAAIEACDQQDGIPAACVVLGIDQTADGDNLTGLCDNTGVVCADDEFANYTTGECQPCSAVADTHVLVGGICEPIAECDADRQILNQTENECETCDFDKSPQNNECVCTDETLFNIAGTCTKPLTCIGNQIRDPEMPTRCINCEDKTANEERNLCEAACTGDNEIKDGEGDCRTCESDSIPNEENTECLPNCSNHDEYKDTDGYCVQCNTGLVASDNNDSCVAVPAVKTPSSKTGIVLGLVVLGVYAANVFAAPAAAEVAAINWTPSYAFRNNNGNISYSVGSRWTARTDNWRYYWQTTQSGGKFSYGSGMNYNTGIFAATMDSESDSDMTDLDISLSATKAAGLWHFNGGYNLDAQLSPTEKTEMQNRLNIAARYSLDKWILSATANTDGERAAARINYSYRF